jgi:alpha-galactosidase
MGLSYFFPSIVTDNHVTDWGKQPLKFRTDVASMGKLGFDIVASHLNDDDMRFAKEAVSNYHSFKNIVWHGDLYRLVNPHENAIASLMYVDPSKSKAIMFSYLVNNRQRLTETLKPVKLAGLEPSKKYAIKEINVYPGGKSPIDSTITYSGDFLMKVGFNPEVSLRRTSVVLEVNEAR